jgi:F1F0 ATPase subunit 2
MAKGAATMIGVVLFAVAGLALGAVHFATLRWTVDAYLRGGRGAMAWYLARVAGAALILFSLVRAGGTLVLATLGGFLVARVVAVRRARHELEGGS